MNASEYANLAAVEAAHWYYAGKRELVRGWIERVRPPRPAFFWMLAAHGG